MSANGVQIYRELGEAPESLLDWLEKRDQLYNIIDPTGIEHVFIDNDLPRDSEITRSIVANTKGFALFSEDGDYIGSYRSLDRAITAQAGAKLVVQAEVEAEPDDFEDDDGEPA
jgi:hypothetical protein